jgi:sialic acid synthase SpsE
MSVLVIAEPGCTAQGDKATMLEMIDVAAACGANVYKATWILNLPEMMRRRNFGRYPLAPAKDANRFLSAAEEYAYFERVYSWHVWPWEWHQDFQRRCHELGMEYACTVHTAEAVKAVSTFVDYFKISSFEAMDEGLRDAGFAHNLRVLVSTGMMDGYEAVIPCWGRLHCVSAYPAPMESMNLARLSRCYRTDGEAEFDGLSDHSRDVRTGGYAVCAGAMIIETHYRLETCDPQNPDYAVAFSPAEFTQYIQNIRDAETMMGTGEKKQQPCEEPMMRYRVKA